MNDYLLSYSPKNKAKYKFFASFEAFFLRFERKVTKKFLYLHRLSILIKLKIENRCLKIAISQAKNDEIAKRRLQNKSKNEKVLYIYQLTFKYYGIYQ